MAILVIIPFVVAIILKVYSFMSDLQGYKRLKNMCLDHAVLVHEAELS